MAYLDAENMFADDQTLIGSNTDVVVSTNVIDFAQGADNTAPVLNNSIHPAPGEPLRIVIQITTAVDSAGHAATLTFGIFTDDAVGFGTDTELFTTPAIAEATMVAGYQVAINFVPTNTLRYLRLKYTIGGEDITAGAYSAWIAVDNQRGESAIATA